MNRLMANALQVGIAIALTASIAACNRDATADAGANAPNSAAAPAAQPANNTAPAPVPAAAPADNGEKYAKVLSVDPVRGSNAPHQVCKDEVVTQTAPPRDQHQIAGTAIGAVAGGLLGHMVGSGKGNTLATVAGAVGGGYAGKRIEENRQQGQVTQSVQQRCHTVQGDNGQVTAYDVRYEYNGVVRTVRMDHDPGDRLRVQEGVVAVSDAR